MFQLNNSFLQDIGLGDLPDDQKQALLLHLYEELELRVGERLAEGMSEDQMQEFESILDKDSEKVHTWLQQHVPDYATQDDFKQVLAAANVADGQPAPIDVVADYTATKWLETNRPNYKQVVEEVMNVLKQELLQNRETILTQA